MSAFAAVILLTVAAALQWKKRAPRFVAVLAFLAGIGLATTIGSWIRGTLSGFDILGVALTIPVAIFVFITFWHDVLPKYGMPRRWSTPVMGLILPALIVSVGGMLGQLANNAVGEVGDQADRTVNKLVGDKGGGK